ncbi:hypothetical protein E2C01_014494 [Portunus trituberculatus]|uniref:Uncharacterized protein n=1 Tax=Portunus trituberculatus TaxID=210409 RepID=A0A5B7DK29_PORTR|nr:hypothetical protein [Portunus trituberculatus]
MGKNLKELNARGRRESPQHAQTDNPGRYKDKQRASTTDLEVVTRSTGQHKHRRAAKDVFELRGGLTGGAVVSHLTGDLTQLLLVVHYVRCQETLLHALGQTDGATALPIHTHLPENTSI